MAFLNVLRKPKPEEPDGDAEPASPDSAAVLAARFGVGRSGAGEGDGGEARPSILTRRWRRRVADSTETSADLFADDPQDEGAEGGRRLNATALAFPLAAAAVVLAAAGTLVWLALSAEQTANRLQVATGPRLVAPVLLPDGTRRFPDPVLAEAAPMDPVDMPVELVPSRNEALLERGRTGLLPKVGADGVMPWQAYARPFPHEDARPRIAIVVTGLGQSATQTATAMDRLPGAVTFAFVPHVAGLQEMVDRVRADGHEVLLSVPMEPLGFPRNDPGPGALLTAHSDEENVRRLEEVMAKATGYVGLTSKVDSGTRFLTRRDDLRPILAQVQRRGLLYFDLWQVADSWATRLADELKMPRALGDLQLDRVANPASIDAQLAELERLAKANGVAVGFAEVQNPVSLDRLAAWATTLKDRGIVLAPVTAVVNRQATR